MPVSPTHSQNPDTALNTSSWFFMGVLGALMAFTSLSTDIYLPAMPQMAQELKGNVELTVTGFLAGFALAQLIWGPMSDRIGRKIPLFIGMILFVIGSIGCALSQSIEQIVFWRVFQAFGACTGPMIGRAMTKVMNMFNGQGRGADLSSAKDTAYGLLCAITEFVDHERRAMSTDHRLDSAWFGAGAALKQRGLEQALHLAV